MCGGHALKSWASTQKNITLSSAEAELVASVKISTEPIGMTQLAADWGSQLKGKVHIDSSAAIGVIQRQGCGKFRHVRVGDLWIQEKVSEGDLEVEKVGGGVEPGRPLHKRIRRKENPKIHGSHKPGVRRRKGGAGTRREEEIREERKEGKRRKEEKEEEEAKEL